MISLSCFILSLNIISDYIFSREIILHKFKNNQFSKFDKFSRLLGLNKGTDRLFKLSLIAFIAALIFGIRFFLNFLENNLSTTFASINGFAFSLSFVISITLYLTATKISTFRSLYTK